MNAITEDVELCSEKHYTAKEVAEILHLDFHTVIRLFRKEPGVIEIGNDERLHRRAYKTIRIPHSVLRRFHEAHRALKPPPVKSHK